MQHLESKHKLVTRWTHWVNFPVLMIMIWSGLLIYWSNDVYTISFGNLTLFHFFPESVYKALNMGHRLAEAMSVHFFFMWLFALNGFVYVTYTVLSGEWRYLVPQRKSFAEAYQVVLHDLKLRKTLPPQGKFNAAQRITYTSIIVMGFGSLLTGLCMYRPTQVAWLTNLLGGYQAVRFEHFWLTMGYLAFFVIHITQVIKAGWNNFRSMVTGLQLVETPLEVKQEVAGD